MIYEQGGGPRTGQRDEIVFPDDTAEVSQAHHFLPNPHAPLNQAFRDAMVGRTLDSTHRRGKQMWWQLSGPDGLPQPLFHFGMTGSFSVQVPHCSGVTQCTSEGFSECVILTRCIAEGVDALQYKSFTVTGSPNPNPNPAVQVMHSHRQLAGGPSHTHAHTHAYTHACTHACTHLYTHTHAHSSHCTTGHTHRCVRTLAGDWPPRFCKCEVCLLHTCSALILITKTHREWPVTMGGAVRGGCAHCFL